MAIYVTGDTHQSIDIHKLTTSNFPEQKELTKNDYVIICGDFGLLWNCIETGKTVESNHKDKCWTEEEFYWKKWLEDKNFTTLFIDGNHENFDRLNTYPISDWNGGKVQKISDSIIHLLRGEIYHIDGNCIFTLGGAMSVDRGPITNTEEIDKGVIWWPEEQMSEKEYLYALDNLNRVNNKVDYVITHDMPAGLNIYYNYKLSKHSNYLEMIRNTISYKHWFCGHMHDDQDYGSISILYQRVLPINYYGKLSWETKF